MTGQLWWRINALVSYVPPSGRQDAGALGLMLGGDRVSFSIVPLSASLVKFPCSMWNRVGRVDIINRLT